MKNKLLTIVKKRIKIDIVNRSNIIARICFVSVPRYKTMLDSVNIVSFFVCILVSS